MGYDREQTKRRRIDVPISPRARSRRGGAAERQYRRAHRQGGNPTSQAWIDAGIVIVSTVVTTVLLLAISGQIRDTTAANLVAESPAPQPEKSPGQPTPPPLSPLLLHADTTPSPQPSRLSSIRPSATPSPPDARTAPAGAADDTEIQAAVDQKLQDDPRLSPLGITSTVNDGKVMLVGAAPSDEIKEHIERLVRAIKGVKQVDNQIVVISNS